MPKPDANCHAILFRINELSRFCLLPSAKYTQSNEKELLETRNLFPSALHRLARRFELGVASHRYRSHPTFGSLFQDAKKS